MPAEPRAPGSAPRRVAIVGCGLVGAKRAAGLPPSAALVAVHDPEPGRAEALQREHGGDLAIAPSAGAAAALAGPGGLAIVATPHDALVPAALAALDEGCHVLVEKPGARNADDLALVAAAASARGLVVRVGYNHRFHPAVAAARDVCRQGRYGPVLLIRGRYGHGGRLGYADEWRAQRARSGGGELVDQGVHLIDLANHLAGPVTLRYASLSTRYWPIDVEDNAFVHLGLAGEAEAWLHASWTEWKNLFSLEITCRQAKLELNGLGGSYGPERLTVYELSDQLGPPLATTTEWPPGDHSWSAELADVLGVLDGGPGIGCSLSDAQAVLRVVAEAYAS